MATARTHSTGPQWPDWMKPGVRIIRGPDFRQTVKDPKFTNLGTLSYVPKTAGGNSRVHVVWDTGQERNYSTGLNGQYELRAYDIQQVGIVHKSIKCTGCKMDPLRGMRFNCSKCDTDLCTFCYHGNKHDLTHAFYRFESPDSARVTLPSRKESPFLKLQGVFEKTDVIRGPHWNYTGADGESGRGCVKAFIDDPADGKAHAWVRVQWDIGKEVKEYRFGAEGFVDIVASKVNPGGIVYADHLPFLGIVKMKAGDKVAVNMSLDEFKTAQKAASVPGGWKDEMKQCLSEIGTVVEMLFNEKLARVQYMNGVTHVVAKEALFRTAGFCEKDAVIIMKDKAKMKVLQEGHGGMNKDMENACGKLGRLLKIHKDGDMEILVNDKRIVISPACLTPVTDIKEAQKAPPVPEEDSDSDEEDDFDPEGDCIPGKKVVSNLELSKDSKNLKDFSEGFGSMYNKIKCNQDPTSIGPNMFEAFAKADLDRVIAFFTQNPELVNFKHEGRTILHLACHEGYMKLVSQLIDAGADMSMVDDEGDTPLHYAAFGKQPDCVQELLQNAADPNVQNGSGLTPLFIAIDHPDIDSVQCLVLNNANVSLRNEDGETAMHNAIEQKEGQPILVEVILSSRTAEHSLCNAENFNVLHWAAYKSNGAAVKIILERNSTLVDVPMEGDCFTALHIAAANDFVEVAGLLLGTGGANPDSRDSQGKTPLHLAVVQVHKRTIELLLDKKADVNARDKDGNTALHLSQLMKPGSKSMRGDTNIQIVYTLLEKGADLHVKNMKGETPVDLIHDQNMKTMIEKLTAAYQKAPAKSEAGVRLPIHWSTVRVVTEVISIKLELNDPMMKQEYGEVERLFKATMPNCNIGSIRRVQNALLWEHFNLKKREMESRYGQGGANEMHLYHGTRPDIVDHIIHDNFDFRIAGSRVGALYGDGSYFATTSKYSDLYASAGDDGYKTMFVAKVLAGKTCVGAPGLKKPPQIDPNDRKKGAYDSCVNNILQPTIYCVFDVNQYYPEYLIEYC